MKKEAVLIIGLFLMVFMIGGVSAVEWSDGSNGNIYSLDGLNYIGGASNTLGGQEININQYQDLFGVGFLEAEVIYGLNNFVHLTIDGGEFIEEPAWEDEGILRIDYLPLPPDNIEGGELKSYFHMSLLDDNDEAIFTTLSSNGNYRNYNGDLIYTARLTLLGREAQIYDGKLSIVIREYAPVFDNSTFNLTYSYIDVKFEAYNIGYNQEQRISALETWKETLMDSLDVMINSIWGQLNLLNTRVDNLENSTCNECGSSNETGAGTWTNFKNYIRSSTRRKMVCGYAEDNRLTHIEELGYSCDLTYRILSTGRERVSCRCKRL